MFHNYYLNCPQRKRQTKNGTTVWRIQQFILHISMRSDGKEQKQVITIVGGFLLWPKALEADYEKKTRSV